MMMVMLSVMMMMVMMKQTNRLLALPQRPLPNLLQLPPDWESLLGLQVKYLPLFLPSFLPCLIFSRLLCYLGSSRFLPPTHRLIPSYYSTAILFISGKGSFFIVYWSSYLMAWYHLRIQALEEKPPTLNFLFLLGPRSSLWSDCLSICGGVVSGWIRIGSLFLTFRKLWLSLTADLSGFLGITM